MADVHEVRPGRPGTAQDLLTILRSEQAATPVQFPRLVQGDAIWWYRDCFYSGDIDASSGDVKVLLDARRLKERRAVDRARATVEAAATNGPRR